jgi:hypothetical protein
MPPTITPIALSPTAPPTPEPTDPPPTPTAAGPSLWLSAVSAVPIFDGPSETYTQVATLEAGEAVIVTGNILNDWFPVQCPEEVEGRCWIFWDYNSLYSYEGMEPLALTIPDPADLAVESTNTTLSPDGRWRVETSRTETVPLAGEYASFFYVETEVVSVEGSTTWTVASEWHAGGLGEEGAPGLFHWSGDGRYLYLIQTFDYHGVTCGLFEFGTADLERLDLSDGSVASFLPPEPTGFRTISPDETWIAYKNGDLLIVRDLAAAFDEPERADDSITWQISLEQVGPDPVSNISWTADSANVLVQTTNMSEECQVLNTDTWELDMESGSFTQIEE